MKKIVTKEEYEAILERIEELLPIVNDDTPIDDENFIEFDTICTLASDYEEVHFPIGGE